MGLIFKLYNEISNSTNDYQIKCGLENLHSKIENIGKEYLNKVYNDDLDFLSSDFDKIRFSLFLGIQYTRTNKMRQRQVRAQLESTNLDIKRLSGIIPFIIGIEIANWIYENGNFTFLINSSTVNFITSDQPIFNLKADPMGENNTRKMELYYPISPKKAIHINQNKRDKLIVKDEDVMFYNNLVKIHSQEQLYGKAYTDLF